MWGDLLFDEVAEGFTGWSRLDKSIFGCRGVPWKHWLESLSQL